MNADTFHGIVGAAPADFALISSGAEVPLRDLIDRGEALARVLETAGLRKYDLVAVVTDSSIIAFISLYACSKVGSVAALMGGSPTDESELSRLSSLNMAGSIVEKSLDDAFPEDSYSGTSHQRLRVLADHYGVVVSTSGTRTRDFGDSPPLKKLLEESEFGSGSDPLALFRTSGTSETPKWVIHSQQSAMTALRNRIESHSGGIQDKCTSAEDFELIDDILRRPRAIFIGIQTISGFVQLCHGLALGFRVLVMERQFPRLALRLASRHDVGIMTVTPSMLRIMLRLPEAFSHDWNGLRIIAVGGGGIEVGLLREAERTFGVRVIQGYGSTEMGGGIANASICDSTEVRHFTVGEVLSRIEMEIRVENGGVAGRGELGEIWVRGPSQLATGYLSTRRKSLSADDKTRSEEEWTFDEIVDISGWHGTGDAGLVREDGTLVVKGRIDDRIVRKDRKFYPQEVELALEAHPHIERALVSTVRHGRDLLVVALCEANSDDVSVLELRRWCKKQLGEWRVPDRFEFGSLPVTANGKTVRYNLREN